MIWHLLAQMAMVSSSPSLQPEGEKWTLTMCERGFDFLWEKKNTESNIIYNIWKQTKTIYCMWVCARVCSFPKHVHSSCIKPHCSSLWFWWDPLWSVCVCTCVCVYLWECVLRLPGILYVAQKDSICSPSALSGSDALWVCVYALFSSCVCICMRVCLWVRKQVMH